MRMHANEVVVTEDLARQLILRQFPQWKGLAVQSLASLGTDHSLFRLGRSSLIRMPKVDWASQQVWKDQEWLPRLAQGLPCRVPQQRAIGAPDQGYPFHWSVCDWIPGNNPDRSHPPGSQVVRHIRDLLVALRAMDPGPAPKAEDHNLRGRPLRCKDEETRKALKQLPDSLERKTLEEIWEFALSVEEWNGIPELFHGDLLPGNLIFEHHQLVGLIDIGGLGAGDSSCDLMVAWHLFSSAERELFRQQLGVDDATWVRGAGHTLSQAALYIPYYTASNPRGTKLALETLKELVQSREALLTSTRPTGVPRGREQKEEA